MPYLDEIPRHMIDAALEEDRLMHKHAVDLNVRDLTPGERATALAHEVLQPHPSDTRTLAQRQADADEARNQR